MSIAELRQLVSSVLSGARETLGQKVTTFCIGGPLLLFEPHTTQELQEILKFLHQEKILYRVLGNGSNLLIPDEGINEIVIRLGRGFRSLKVNSSDSIEVGAAMSLMSLSRELSDQGLSGLEFAGGIPASMGGALWMNAGAHGSETESIVKNVQLVLSNGELMTLSRNEINFSYRHSGLPASSIVIGAEISLKEENVAVTSQRRATFLAERKKRQPLTVPSAGSVFRNPLPERSAGKLIDEVGLRGLRIGGAEISPLHGNWITNPERTARFADVMKLIKHCQQEVFVRHHLDLHEELVHW